MCRPIPVIESENSLNCPIAEGDMRWNSRTWESGCPGNTVELIQDPVVVQVRPLWEAVLEEIDRDGAAEVRGRQEDKDTGDVEMAGRKRQHSQPGGQMHPARSSSQEVARFLKMASWRLLLRLKRGSLNESTMSVCGDHNSMNPAPRSNRSTLGEASQMWHRQVHLLPSATILVTSP